MLADHSPSASTTTIITAAAKAYLNALNRLVFLKKSSSKISKSD